MTLRSADRIEFTKMDGLGNDFIVVDARRFSPAKARRTLSSLKKNAPKLAHRRTGIGFDQILFISPPRSRSTAQKSASRIKLTIIDADGSIAEMCGNGVRAIHVFLRAKRLQIETLAGVIETRSTRDGQVAVKMGVPKLLDTHAPFVVKAGGKTFKGFRVEIGNPHFVIFSPKAEAEIERFGPLIEKHKAFKHRTNVEWVSVLSDRSIRVDVWERGSGRTLACGTGACASYAVAVSLGKIRPGSGEVEMPGGTLEISWKNQGETVLMTGPAKTRFSGSLKI